MKAKCSVYKSANKAETYLYLKTGHHIEDLPDGLQQLLGELSQVLQLDLHESSNLAQVKACDVIESLNDQGYFLQMPPGDRLESQIPGTGFIQ